MIKKFITLLLFVYSVVAYSSFIGDKKRAELFELTDDEIPEVRITLPDEEYKLLMAEASKGYLFYLPNGESVSFNKLRGLKEFPQIDYSLLATADESFNPYQQKTFETKNATMTFKINGNVEKYDTITFKLGGTSSRMFYKLGYNIKIRGKQNIHGRTQIKLRPDAREATFLRTKLASDIHHRLGLPAISANYATLYINDIYFGLYILMDSIKKSWIELENGDAKTTSLYECKSTGNDLSVEISSKKCENENEEITDTTELVEFLTALDNAKSAADIEDIFDVDLFLSEIVYEFLSGSWDHYLLYGHNFLLYKPKEGKWKYIINDFDGDFGQDISVGFAATVKPILTAERVDFPNYSFKEWASLPRHLLDILIFNDPSRFDALLKNIVNDVFNPATLFPHIDKLKEMVRPYVELDKTPDADGHLPGRVNEEAEVYSFAQWEANCEFTTVRTMQHSRAYGLKYWILAKYRYVCKAYNLECDPVYLDENYEYAIDKTVESPVEEDSWLDWDNSSSLWFGGEPQPTEVGEDSQPTEVGEDPQVISDDEEDAQVISDDDDDDVQVVSDDDDVEEPQVVSNDDEVPEVVNDDDDNEKESKPQVTKTIKITKTKSTKSIKTKNYKEY